MAQAEREFKISPVQIDETGSFTNDDDDDDDDDDVSIQ